jgi:hypothetical protein
LTFGERYRLCDPVRPKETIIVHKRDPLRCGAPYAAQASRSESLFSLSNTSKAGDGSRDDMLANNVLRVVAAIVIHHKAAPAGILDRLLTGKGGEYTV